MKSLRVVREPVKISAKQGDFSMTQIDEVSNKLGGIEATQSHILRSVNTIESLIKDISSTSILHGSSIDAAHKRLDRIEPKVDTLEETEDKRQGAWAVIVWVAGLVGTAFGVLGGYIAKWIGLV